MAQFKHLMVRYGAQIAHFAEVLCSLFSPSHPLPTLNIPQKFGRPEFQVVFKLAMNTYDILITQTVVYPVLAALASYNRSLEASLQKQLIKCFQYGLVVSKCNQVGKHCQCEFISKMQVCVVALTACIHEMSSTMCSLLPEVLFEVASFNESCVVPGFVEFQQDIGDSAHCHPCP